MIANDEDVVAGIEARLAATGRATMRAWGASMVPTIFPGSQLHVRRVSESELRPGDVVIARRGDALVAHRFLGTRAEGLICRGDAFDHPEDPFPFRDVLGIVEGVHIGRARLPLPRRFETAINATLLDVVNAFRPYRAPSLRLLRRATNQLLRARAVGRIRRSLQPWHVGRLQYSDLSELRRAMLRRGLRPSATNLRPWLACAQARELPFGMVARDERGGRVVGYVRAHWLGCDTVALPDLYVQRSHRGLGIANAMAAAALERLRSLPIRPAWVRVDVREGSAAAMTATRLGFEPARTITTRSAAHMPMLLALADGGTTR